MKINFNVKEKGCVINYGDVLVTTDNKLIMVTKDEINDLVRFMKLPEMTLTKGEYTSLTTLAIDVSFGKTIHGYKIKEIIPTDRIQLSLV